MSTPLETVTSAMGIVIARPSQSANDYVLVLESEGELMLPKGRLEAGESSVKAAIREVSEEAGIMVDEAQHLGRVCEFGFEFKKKAQYKKILVELFRLATLQDITPNKLEGFDKGEWLPTDVAINSLTHSDARQALEQAVEQLRKIDR